MTTPELQVSDADRQAIEQAALDYFEGWYSGDAERMERSLAQGALLWILSRSPRAVPIPGFRTMEQVELNAGFLA